MGILSRLFGGDKATSRMRQPTTGNNVGFVMHLNLLSISNMNRFVERYPELDSVLKRSSKPMIPSWTLYMNAAGVGLALLSEECSETTRKAIIAEAAQVDPLMPRAVENLHSHLQNDGTETEDTLSLTGLWVLRSIGGEEPSYEEMKALAPAIGSYLNGVVAAFFGRG